MVADKDLQARERGGTVACSLPWRRRRSCPKPSRSSTQDGKTAVSEAARYQHPAVLTLLLDKGADIEVKDEVSHCTPAAATPTSRTHSRTHTLLAKFGAWLCGLVLFKEIAGR